MPLIPAALTLTTGFCLAAIVPPAILLVFLLWAVIAYVSRRK